MQTWKAKTKTLLLTTSIVFIFISLVAFPKAAYNASLDGLKMWWDVVFPSLLPFFIVSELLIGFGIVSLLGVIFEPLMRPLFHVPGAGGLVWAMGLASGYPAGAKLTARLRQEKQLSKIQAERLAAFTNYSNPLFIFGAVAVGFFQKPELGVLIALCHYLGNFFVGIVMRFYGHDQANHAAKKSMPHISLRRAFRLLHRERMKENRPLGKLLGDAVSSSVSTLLMIGGFIILFSVINKILSIVHITDIAVGFFAFIFTQLHLPAQLSEALVPGFFEITLGNQMASQIDVSLLYQVMIAGFILAFSGLSVHAQVASILAETDIRFQPFFVARCLHGVFSAILTLLLWKPLYLNRDSTPGEQSIHAFDPGSTLPWWEIVWQFLLQYGSLITLLTLLVYIGIKMQFFYRRSPAG